MHQSVLRFTIMIRNTYRRSLPRHLWQSSCRVSCGSGLPGLTVRTICCSAAHMSTQLPSVRPPISTQLPSDSFQLLSIADKAGASEDALFEEQVRAVKEWWATPRFEGIKRPYTAEDVVSKRGSLQQSYPSSIMARKLFNLLNEREAEKKPVHTRMRPSNMLIYMELPSEWLTVLSWCH